MKTQKTQALYKKHIHKENEYFHDPRYGRKNQDKISDTKQEYIDQYCWNCGHTIEFNLAKAKICSNCGKINKNQTKGRFLLLLNKQLMKNKEYKVIKLDGDGNICAKK